MRQTRARPALIVVVVPQHRLEQAEAPNDHEQRNGQQRDDADLHRARETADEAPRHRKARGAQPQQGNGTLLA